MIFLTYDVVTGDRTQVSSPPDDVNDWNAVSCDHVQEPSGLTRVTGWELSNADAYPLTPRARKAEHDRVKRIAEELLAPQPRPQRTRTIERPQPPPAPGSVDDGVTKARPLSIPKIKNGRSAKIVAPPGASDSPFSIHDLQVLVRAVGSYPNAVAFPRRKQAAEDLCARGYLCHHQKTGRYAAMARSCNMVRWY